MISDFSFSRDTIGFMVDGKVTASTIDELNGLILKSIKEFDKINLYIEDANVASVSIPALFREMEFKLKYASHFNKIAIVTDKSMLNLIVDIEKLIAAYKIKSFATEDRLCAMNWISER